MTASPTTFELRHQAAVTVVRFRESRLVGSELTSQMDRELVSWLTTHPSAQVVFDFSALGYVTSDFLAKLIGWQAKIRQGQGRLKLCGLGAPLQELFEATKLSKKIEVLADADAAVSSF